MGRCPRFSYVDNARLCSKLRVTMVTYQWNGRCMSALDRTINQLIRSIERAHGLPRSEMGRDGGQEEFRCGVNQGKNGV